MNRWHRTTLQQQREQHHANRASHRATPRKDREFPVRDSQGRHIDTYASLPVGAKPSTDYDSGRVVGNSSLTGLWKDCPFFIPYVLKRSDTLTLCKEHLKLDPRAGWPRRFYSVYRPWLSRSCFIGWARISGKGGLLGGVFSTCC